VERQLRSRQAASATNCLYGNGNFSLLAEAAGRVRCTQNRRGKRARAFPRMARAMCRMWRWRRVGHDNIVYCTSHVGAGPACQIDAQNNLVGLTLVGGTSAATPAMAGILALVEQQNGVLQGR